MDLARGSKSWILSAIIPAVIFLFLAFLSFEEIRMILFLISILFFILTIAFIIFFRDPDREIGREIVACADGKIREIETLNDEQLGKCVKISTFMNIYDVHVNRMPLSGIIKNIVHVSGSYVPAFMKESEKNERIIIIIDSKIGLVKIVQIAGTLARRIVPYIKESDKLDKGERIGVIRLGSRVDVYLPYSKNLNLCVKKSDYVKAGVDTVAEIND